MPRPPSDRSRLRSPWMKRSKTCGTSSALIPIPSSRTLSTVSSPLRVTRTHMWPPSGVNLAALLRRLRMTWGEARGIAVHTHGIAPEIHLDRVVPLLEERERGLDRPGDDGREVEHLPVQDDLAARDPADVEQVVHEPTEVPHLALDQLARPDDGGVRHLAGRHHGHGVADGGERVAQLVAEHGEELVDLPALLLERLHALAPGEVARDLGEPAQGAGRVVHGRDDHVGPEAGAVLADAPSLVLEPARPAGHLQLVVRPARGHLLGRVEHGEMPSDDLLAPVALDPLRARVPTGHMAGGVEHEDPVVEHGFDHEPELVLAILRVTTRVGIGSAHGGGLPGHHTSVLSCQGMTARGALEARTSLSRSADALVSTRLPLQAPYCIPI